MTISIRRHLDSETLVLPELQPMIGRDVRIIVIEESAPGAKKTELGALDRLAGTIDLDFQAIEDLRAQSLI
jgi:hypothetical protein